MDKSIHAIGNGKFLIYGRGADITHVFGPPYTSCNQFSLVSDESIHWVTFRKVGTFIWKHVGYLNQEKVVEFTDVIHPEYPIFSRKIEVHGKDILLVCKYPAYGELVDYYTENELDPKYKGRIMVHEGSPVFDFHTDYYVSLKPTFLAFHALGNLEVEHDANIHLILHQGASELRIIGGPSFPENRKLESISSKTDFKEIIASSEKASKRFFSRISPIDSNISKMNGVDNICQLMEDVSLLIVSQQGQDGGVVAGYPFQMAYVRDQYGVARGLLAMGLFDEAEHIMEFRWNKWKIFGGLENAEMIGCDYIRHIHENDDVEITAYTILTAFDFQEATGLYDRLIEWFPMLAWCFEAQIPHLVNGMLPFNGDETYIAGGVLKRNHINDGSAEATLLFIESGIKLLKFAQIYRLWDENKISSYNGLLMDTKSKYLSNFLHDGIYVTNNPDRTRMLNKLPDYRHGVCMGCSFENDTAFGWMEHAGDNNYFCPKCKGKIQPEVYNFDRYVIPSTCLLPTFIGSSLVPEKILDINFSMLLSDIEKAFDGNGDSNKCFVGYDLGFMLYYAVHVNHPLIHKIFEYVINSKDSISSWSERYIGDRHDGCRARPWESAISITSILAYLKRE